MGLFKKIALFLFVCLILFVLNVLYSTGFFRTIEPKFEGRILEKIAIKGAEDITISLEDSFALVSATSRKFFPATEEEIGGIYLIDLKNGGFTPSLLTADFEGAFAPHGISIYKTDSVYRVLVVNHTPTGHSVEVFDLNKGVLKHLETLRSPSMIRPNDLVLLDKERFYYTNDHGYEKGIGKVFEEYLGLALGNVVYYDGKAFHEVADGIAYANGINIDRSRDLVFVASPRAFSVKVYAKNEDASLSFIEDIPCGTGVDNIEFDEAGHLLVGCHPNLLRFNAYAQGKKETAPSEIIKIDYRGKGDYSVEKIYVEDGSVMSGSTVAAPFGNLLFVGNVMDEAFLVLELSK